MKSTFSFTAGCLVRKSVIFELKRAAREHGVALDILGDGGWLQTEYSVVVEGDEPKVSGYLKAVREWVMATSQEP